MGKFESLIERLDKVKRSGRNVRAACPVHGSKGQTLSVTEKDGGWIVAHCFACGAGGPELIKALGLDLGLIFPEGEYSPPVITQEMKRKNIEAGLLAQMIGKPETLEESRAMTQSKERLKGYDLKAEQSGEDAPEINHPALDPFRDHFGPALESSPALRSELADAHWQGVADRVKRRERRIVDTAAAFSELEPASQPTAEAWLLGL